MQCRPRIVVDAFSPCMCALTNGVQQPVHSAPSVFPARKLKQYWSPSYAQSKPQMYHPQRIWWLLVAVSNATRIALGAIGWLKKKEDKQYTSFRLSQVFHFKVVTTHCYYCCRLGHRLCKLLDILSDASIYSLVRIHVSGTVKTLIHWLELPSWNRAIPTYGLHYHEPIIEQLELPLWKIYKWKCRYATIH